MIVQCPRCGYSTEVQPINQGPAHFGLDGIEDRCEFVIDQKRRAVKAVDLMCPTLMGEVERICMADSPETNDPPV